MSSYRDLSPFFLGADVGRRSLGAALARLHGASFSLFVHIADALRLTQLVEWLNAKLTR